MFSFNVPCVCEFKLVGTVCYKGCVSAGPSDSVWLTLAAAQSCESRPVKERAGKTPEQNKDPYSVSVVGLTASTKTFLLDAQSLTPQRHDDKSRHILTLNRQMQARSRLGFPLWFKEKNRMSNVAC